MHRYHRSLGREAPEAEQHDPQPRGACEPHCLGYASAEIQADGDGYLDFIALAAGVRGRGLGAGLLSAIGRAVLALSPNGCVNLTVKASNAPAVALYERFGFVREAELVGYRSGPSD